MQYSDPTLFSRNSIPANAVGIGLRTQHHSDVLHARPTVDFFEVHSENFFQPGGPAHEKLTKIRRDYPLSLHGVGLSLGSTDALNEKHLKCLEKLVERYQPALVSEHLSWSSSDGHYMPDLLPLPMTQEVVHHVADRIATVQELLGRQILIENASTYLEFTHSEMPEWEFITETAKRSGSGILLDINNVFVNAENHNFDPLEFLENIPPELIGEIHLAGHTVNTFSNGSIRIDTHDQLVCDEVWDLYRTAKKSLRDVPTLVEWDQNLPELSVLLGEADTARKLSTAPDSNESA